MLCGGPCASVHLWDHRHPPTLGAKVSRQSSFVHRAPSAKLQQRMKSFSRSHCETPGQIPVAHDCFSQGEDDPELPVEGLSPVAGGVVALGKFARCISVIESLQFKLQELVLHIYCILLEWLKYSVGNLGENYRFGYRASGDASELVRLCKECGISAYIINSLMDKNQISGNADTEEDSNSKERGQVSSTRDRHALATELLGRPHRVISKVRTQDIMSKGGRISLQTSSLLNLPPGNGVYKACSLIIGDKHPISCKVVVDTWNLIIETEEVEEARFRNLDGSQEFLLLGIEFG